MEYNCIKFMDDARAERIINILESKATIQTDYCRLDIRFSKNLWKFNKSKNEVLLLHSLPR